MDELAFCDATALLERLRARALRAEDLLEHLVGRIERHDPRLNAVVTRDFDAARARARDADARLDAGGDLPPLLGLPMTVKDTFEVAGMRTTAGAPALAEHVPERSATAVARLVAAGANVVGKTNTPLFAGDGQTFNELFGTTNNPWDVARTPGGSSGGSAAALAAGLTPLELGSDIGGSIRVPSHFCGVFGHKPTWGIVPDRGHIPGPPGQLAETDLAVIGPLARSARDLALALEVLAGREPAGRHTGWRLELPAPRATGPEALRIAAWLDDPFSPVDGEYRGLLERAAEALEREGTKVDRDARPEVDFPSSFAVYATLLHAVMASGFPEAILEQLAEQARALDPGDASHRALQARGASIPHHRWLAFDEMRAHIRAAWERFFLDVDAILLPVHPTVAFAHQQDPDLFARTLRVDGREQPYLDFLHWMSHASLAGLPASVAPVGRTDAGLPAGIQVVGPAFGDRTTLQVAGWIAERCGGFVPPPHFAD